MQAYDAELSAAEARGKLDSILKMVERFADQKIDAHDVERKVFDKLLVIGLELMKCFFARAGTGNVGSRLLRDGKILKIQKNLQSKGYFSIFGKLNVPRSRYRERVGESSFPLDAQVNLPKRCYSYVLQEMANKLSADLPFREASNYLKEFLGIGLSESVFIDLAKDAGSAYQEYYEKRPPPTPDEEGEIMVVSLDGKGIPMIRKEAVKLKARLGKGEKRLKKKEALVGVSYTVDPKYRTASELAESLTHPEAARSRRLKKEEKKLPKPKAKNIRRIASLAETKNDVFASIRDDARRRDPKHRRRLAVLLDGARVLERLARSHFRDWKQTSFILDIIHVRDYLWEMANPLLGEKTEDARIWVQNKLKEILSGRIGYVIGGLRQTLTKRRKVLRESQIGALEKAITYFDNHQEMMRYDEYLAEGLPVSTSIVESSCGTLVAHRMEGSGKRWGIVGAEAVLKLRSLKMSNANDLRDFAKFRAKREHILLYGKAA